MSASAATGAPPPVPVPASALEGNGISGLTTTLSGTGAAPFTAYAVLNTAGPDQRGRQPFSGAADAAVPGLTPHSAGTFKIKRPGEAC